MKKEVLTVILTLTVLFGFSLAVAGPIESGNNWILDENTSMIEQNYTEGEFVKGVLNMSFDGQGNSDFSSNFGENKISLLDLLEAMSYVSGTDFTCDPLSCLDDFSSSNGEETKDFSLNGQVMYGFKMTGADINVENLRFNITSSAGLSCINQISLDLFVDGEEDLFNSQYSSSLCESIPRSYGCFDFDEDFESAIIGSIYYCEKITLPPAPAYTIGARIKKIEAGAGDLEMRLFDLGNSFEEHCDITPGGTVGFTQEADCVAEYSSRKSFDAFVCIRDLNAEGDYEMNIESSLACGGVGFPTDEESYLDIDFEIYAQPMMYKAFGSVRFDSDLYEEQNDEDLVQLLNAYVSEVYDNDCTEDCVIPFKILGGNQDVSLHDSKITYRRGNLGKSNKDIYDLEGSPFVISADGVILDVEKMEFEVPPVNGTHNFLLEFGSETLWTEDLTVKVGFDFNMGPKFVTLGLQTIFTAVGSVDLDTTTWNFGDGSLPFFSSDNTAIHTYTNESNYTVEVTAVSFDGDESIKTFNIVVGRAEQAANTTLLDYEGRISDIKRDIALVSPSWVRDEVRSEINLNSLESDIVRLRNNFETQSSNYVDIVNDLLSLNVPLGVSVTSTRSLPAEVGYNNINTGHIAELSGSSETGSATRQAIIAWIQTNYNINVDTRTISLIDQSGNREILTSYRITATQKGTASGEDVYLFVDHPSSAIVGGPSYSGNSISGGSGIYVEVDGSSSSEVLEFVILGANAPSVENLATYISPVIESLGSIKPIADDPFTKLISNFRWGRFLIGLGIVLISLFAIYILLQSWYKRNYERHLFKNPNDLYNLINFIYNSRKAGLTGHEIRKKLGEKKWKKEQVTYAFKKIDGKRTGMWEIPLFKFAENRKVKRELEKKQHGRPIDTRFIKRPGL